MNKLISLLTLLSFFSQTVGFAADSPYTIQNDKIQLGKHSAADKTLIFNKGLGSTNPKIKWDNTTSKLKFSNDGTNFANLGSGSGGSGQNYLTNGDLETQLTDWTQYNDAFTFATTDVDTGAETITETSHGLLDGDQVSFTSSTTLPAGLSAATIYYVVGRTANTFQVSTTLGGAAVNLTSQGTGTHTCYPAQPINGTGSTPALAWTASSSSPLSGTYSLLYAHGAANEVGNGISTPFTIDAKDKGKSISVEFDETLVSGTYSTSANTAYSDLTVWIYDITNGVRIQPSTYNVSAGVAGANIKHVATFPTASDSVSYRLVLSASTYTATAYSLKLDNFRVGPQSAFVGPPVTSWVSFVPTGSWVSNSTYTGQWRRVGDSMQVQVKVATSGAPTTAALTINIPGGYTIDTTKILSTPSYYNPIFGQGIASDSDGTAYRVSVTYHGTTSINFSTGGTGQSVVNQAAPFTFGAGDSIVGTFQVPIVGWGSTVSFNGQDADQRLIAAHYYTSGTRTPTSAKSVNYDTKVLDTHGAVTTVSGDITGWRFTAPVSGTYRVSVTAFASGVSNSLLVYKNAASFAYIVSTNVANIYNGSILISANAGDYFEIRADGTPTLGSLGTGNSIYIEKLPQTSQIAASDTVAARFTTAAGQSIATNNFSQIVDFGTKVFDTHGAVTTGASWKFTAPIAGTYAVKGDTLSDVSGGWAATEHWQLRIYKNGVAVSALGGQWMEATHTARVSGGGADTIKLVAGDYIDFRVYQTSGGALAMAPDAEWNYVSIERIGN